MQSKYGQFSVLSCQKCAFELDAQPALSTLSSIATNDATNFRYNMISDCGLGHQFEYDVPQDVTFNISQQVTLHDGADIIGILVTAMVTLVQLTPNAPMQL